MTVDAQEMLRRLLLAPVDPILADLNRLRVAAALVGLPPGGQLSFTALRKLLDLTDGNLGQHVRVLAETGYVDVTRTSHGRRPQSLYAITAAGRAAFERHSEALAAIMAAGGRPTA